MGLVGYRKVIPAFADISFSGAGLPWISSMTRKLLCPSCILYGDNTPRFRAVPPCGTVLASSGVSDCASLHA